jgi:hypothetical protein
MDLATAFVFVRLATGETVVDDYIAGTMEKCHRVLEHLKTKIKPGETWEKGVCLKRGTPFRLPVPEGWTQP